MDIDFATIIKYFLSILIGFLCVAGSVIWSNYDKFENPALRRKQVFVGVVMVIIGLSIATGYYYARQYDKIPEFMKKSEGMKAEERAKKKAEEDKALESAKKQQEAKDKEAETKSDNS